MNLPRPVAAAAVLLLGSSCGSLLAAQEVARFDRATQERLKSLSVEIANAQKVEDLAEVQRRALRLVQLLGDQAGLPEAPDEYRTVPANAQPLTSDELATAFDPYLELIDERKWWHVGLDPAQTNHALREVASVIEGCLAARQVSSAKAEQLLAIAREAGDFLLWAQNEAGTGLFPFPAVRNGSGRPFEVAERFMRRAEQEGRLDQVIRNGWTIDDFDDGGLQFDNGLAGTALVRLFEATGESRYRQAALRSADWAISRRVVPNWNYNSFSVLLLAEAYRISGEAKYLEAAKQKTTLGVLPGQLTEGPRRGCWADPHNARPPYHYIMIRALTALAAAMPEDDSALGDVVESLRLALSARNFDFQRGVFNADSSVEALVAVQSLPPHVAEKLQDCGTEEALDVLQRYTAEKFRTRNAPLGPGAWGLLLEYRQRQLR